MFVNFLCPSTRVTFHVSSHVMSLSKYFIAKITRVGIDAFVYHQNVILVIGFAVKRFSAVFTFKERNSFMDNLDVFLQIVWGRKFAGTLITGVITFFLVYSRDMFYH